MQPQQLRLHEPQAPRSEAGVKGCKEGELKARAGKLRKRIVRGWRDVLAISIPPQSRFGAVCSQA